jgi:hypothetical protein
MGVIPAPLLAAYGSAAILALVGVALIGWALAWGCWYNLSMNGGGTPRCPECGRALAGRNALFRTRRRWRWAACGLLPILAAVQAANQPHRSGEGWTRWVPTLALCALADLTRPGPPDAVSHALWLRSTSLTCIHAALISLRTPSPGSDNVRAFLRTRPAWTADGPVIVKARVDDVPAIGGRSAEFKLRVRGAVEEPAVRASAFVGPRTERRRGYLWHDWERRCADGRL